MQAPRPSLPFSQRSLPPAVSETDVLNNVPISQMEVAVALSKANLYLDVLSELERRIRFAEAVVLTPADTHAGSRPGAYLEEFMEGDGETWINKHAAEKIAKEKEAVGRAKQEQLSQAVGTDALQAIFDEVNEFLTVEVDE